ncbi:hypothetical protein CK203_109735 [Vitis vinifera]|uniref:Uncharacterized protein n=1 Tax=Vitis vinifera TaxID=29760 RepID=A0A438BT97_VITVI|nr:hypothetical protein CK203_109735 [Vitis vinifera]
MRGRDCLTSFIYFYRYYGVLNGIDAAMWNPATDVFLPSKFNGNIPPCLSFCN